MQAMDADESDNANLTYFLRSVVNRDPDPSDFTFSVQSATGEIRVLSGGSAQPCLPLSYMLEVAATDGGIPARLTIARVLVQVLGASDGNALRYDVDSYAFFVPEDVPMGSALGRMTAACDWMVKDQSQEFLYSTTSEDLLVDERTGVVSTRRNLDRETLDRYMI